MSTVGIKHSAKEGIWLSAEGYARVEKMFRDATAEIASGEAAAINFKKSSVFDDLYAGIYSFVLGRSNEIQFEPEETPPGTSKLLSLKASLAPRLPKYAPGIPFDESLIDENVVTDITMFIAGIKRLVPYPTVPEKILRQDFQLEFGIYGSPMISPLGTDLPFLPKATLEAPADRTLHPAWKMLKTRFAVRSIQLTPHNG